MHVLFLRRLFRGFQDGCYVPAQGERMAEGTDRVARGSSSSSSGERAYAGPPAERVKLAAAVRERATKFEKKPWW